MEKLKGIYNSIYNFIVGAINYVKGIDNLSYKLLISMAYASLLTLWMFVTWLAFKIKTSLGISSTIAWIFFVVVLFFNDYIVEYLEDVFVNVNKRK